MLVHVITAANRGLYEDVLEDFLRLRHEVYVRREELAPSSANGLERDQFDTDAATYLVASRTTGLSAARAS